MYGTILVPLDGSRFAERALGPAAEVAAAEGARITLVSVSDAHDAAPYLREVTEKLGVPSTVLAVDGTQDAPGAVIAGLAAERPDALLCMATHGRTGVRRAVLGSVTEEVLRSLDAPVLLTGPYVEPDRPIVGGKLLVCLDGSERSEAILPHATAWTKNFDMKLWLTAVTSSDPSVARREFDKDVLESNYLARLAHDLDHELTSPVNWDTLHGPRPAVPITDLAARLPAAVIAVTTHGRTGLSRMALGSVAMELVHDSPCPVLVQRSV